MHGACKRTVSLCQPVSFVHRSKVSVWPLGEQVKNTETGRVPFPQRIEHQVSKLETKAQNGS